MDPDATLKALLEAVVARDRDTVQELSDALLRWLDQMGFPPKTVGPWKLGQDWHASLARTICALARIAVNAEAAGKPLA